MPQTALFLHCQMSAKNHLQGYFWPIPVVSLFRECQIPMNLMPAAKITSTADNNTQRHIPAPHLPLNYALKTFKATALITLKNWLQLPLRWIPNLTYTSNFDSSAPWLLLCQMEVLMPRHLVGRVENRLPSVCETLGLYGNEHQHVIVHSKAVSKCTAAMGKMNSCTSIIKWSIS